MKIAAWSDGHGTLPKIDQYVDVVIIAGDIVPLQIQRNTQDSLTWFATDFFNYVKKLNCKKVIMIPGNHDFIFERISPDTIKGMINGDPFVSNKLVYLVDEEYEYKGFKFYGTPWCKDLANWAFYTADPAQTFSHIPSDTNILISHMPPKIDKVGCSNPYQPYERDFGSDSLRNAIEVRDSIKYVFCGHVHTGIHDSVQFNNAMIYNVSIKDESYKDVFDVTYLDI